jgi:hypothetical protein
MRRLATGCCAPTHPLAHARYLEEISSDPLSGAPLKYIVKDKGLLLYSVGRNGVDDQGQTRDDAEQEEVAIQPEWDDITVRVGR